VRYTIRSAQWGSAAQDSAVLLTAEVGYVAISAVDNPGEWEAFQAWAKSNAVAAALALPAPRADPLERRLAAIEARLGIVTPPAS